MCSEPPPQLAAIHKLEFYKKISKWSFTREETPSSDDSPNLNGTYDVLPALTDSQSPDDEDLPYMESEPLLSSSLHKASLESLESECSFMSRADLVPHSSRAELRARNMTNKHPESYVCEPPCGDLWRPGELTTLLSLPSDDLLQLAQWELHTAQKHARRHHALLAVYKGREDHETSQYQRHADPQQSVPHVVPHAPQSRPTSAPLSHSDKRVVIVGGRPYTF